MIWLPTSPTCIPSVGVGTGASADQVPSAEATDATARAAIVPTMLTVNRRRSPLERMIAPFKQSTSARFVPRTTSLHEKRRAPSFEIGNTSRSASTAEAAPPQQRCSGLPGSRHAPSVALCYGSAEPVG